MRILSYLGPMPLPHVTRCAVALAVVWLGFAPEQSRAQRAGPGPGVSEPGDRVGPPSNRPSQGEEGPNRATDGRRGPAIGRAKKPKPIPKTLRRPGASSVPERASQRAQLLRELYAHLATAKDAAVAKRIGIAIERVWASHASDTITLLMRRAQLAYGTKNADLALELLNRAVKLAPDNPEVFNQRAIVHFSQEHVDQALGDLRRVLALDPNHYKALEGLGQILKEIGKKKAALRVYRRLHEVHPFLPDAKAAIQELAREVEGRRS